MNHKLITDRLFYQKVLSIMLPVALQHAINMGGQMGEVQISASSLANQYYNFFTIFCMGIIGGSSVLAAQYWGARDLNKVQQTFCLAIRMALLFSMTFALLTWLFPAQIMRIYTPDPAVIEQGVRYLRITTFVFVIHGTSLVAEQLMRSVGQARLGLVVSSISFVVNLDCQLYLHLWQIRRAKDGDSRCRTRNAFCSYRGISCDIRLHLLP